MDLISAVLVLLLILLLLLIGFWVLLPILFGSPWVPTFPRRIRRALDLAQVRPGETVIDLGSGDGRVLLIAARDYQARAVGYEVEPVHCLVSGLRARLAGAQESVSVICGDFMRADVREADVVFFYLTAGQAARLQPLLEAQLRPGTRVISVSSELPGWLPAAIDREHLLFLYRMPPERGDMLAF